jgi:hypothetical protein
VKNLGGIKFDFANPIDTLNNGINDTAQVLPIFQEIGAPVEINLILLLKKQVLITTLNLGIFRFYCWKDPFIPCLKTGSYLLTKQRLSPYKMIVISDGDLKKPIG